MIYCENCGKQVNDEAQFCSHCGNEIVNLADDKPRKTNIISKKVFIGIIAGAVALTLILGICIGAAIGDSGGSSKTKTVALTKENFYEYFAYEVTSHTYYDNNSPFCSFGGAEITLTFYPLQNIEIENGEIAIKIQKANGIKENIYIYEEVPDYRKGITKSATITYDGNFSIKFAHGGTCTIHWFDSPPSFDNLIEVTIESVSGTIILK